LPVPQVKSDVEEKERELFNRQLREASRLRLQAGMVRYMKSRKTVSHLELVADMVSLSASWNIISVTVAEIKKCIELLIESEYIERDPNSPKLYHYVI
jgi:hypothetical protein